MEPMGTFGLIPCAPRPRQLPPAPCNRHWGCGEGDALLGAGLGVFGGPMGSTSPPDASPGKGGSKDGAGRSGTRHWGGKFVKKVLNTDFLGYQKENLCIAFEFNFSIKAFSL